MLENFHFIEPLWLLALLPLLPLAWALLRSGGGDNPWRRIVDARLLPILMGGKPRKTSRAAPWLATAGWIIAVLALANPTWQRKPQPVYQTTAATVVVLDLARSMNSRDLAPSRLVRARYKIEDVLARSAEGQTALVVYAGDAFTVSPLTRDAKTIRALLPVLDPSLMPADGSRADLGLLKAGQLLHQAGASSGVVLLIADAVAPDALAASERAAQRLKGDGYRVSVLGVGAEDGATLRNATDAARGDGAGNIAHPRMDVESLRALAQAGGGEYRSISDSGEALGALLRDEQRAQASGAIPADATAQGWKELGPYLALLLLPLAALAFRRNWLVALVLLAGFALPPKPAQASTWDDLWLRPDQQAAKALAAGDYSKALELATSVDRRGSAEYKRGNYRMALEDFAGAKGADADYNRGNALAKLGQYPEAIAAYEQSLRENPANDDARVNKQAVEALLRKAQQAQAAQGQGAGQQGEASQKDRQKGEEPGTSQGQGRDRGQSGGAGGDSSSANASPGRDGKPAKGGTPQEAAPAGPGQSKEPGGPFSDAARKLDEQRAGSKGSQSPPAGADAAANAGATAGATAGADASSDQGAGASGAALAADEARAGVQGEGDGRTHATDRARLDTEEQMAAEQWLRRIPDDPGGLLRRKFLYQYRQREQNPDAAPISATGY